MKYISIVVPCYNSQDYLERCIDSLLPGGSDVEIIIVDDGSTDRTGAIADRYEREFPHIVKTVHKQNGGHGSGVNKGLELASGCYFKVVDSDDWLDQKAYLTILDDVRNFVNVSTGRGAAHKEIPDLIVCNYVYDHLEEGKQRIMRYQNVFPDGTVCTWNDIGHFRPSQYLIMHALLFRTEILRRCRLRLPEHMFYVDNLFSYQPLPLVQNIYYRNLDLYHYYLGREDQSVNEKVLMERIDQQIYVTKRVSRCVNLPLVAIRYPKLAVYMKRNISIMMSISCIHLLLIHTQEARQKREQLWIEIKRRDPALYHYLRYRTLSGFTYLPGKLGEKLTVGGYRIANRIYKFQ